MLITDGYLEIITPVILDNKLIIIAFTVPVIEIITPTFYDIEYAILN